jgi:hypothetical protein
VVKQSGTAAIPNIAINTPLVGIMRFEKPSPGMKASTADCLEEKHT